MLLRKDIEAIMSTPELWRGFHILEQLYSNRRNSLEDMTTYKLAFQSFRAQVESHKGQNIPF